MEGCFGGEGISAVVGKTRETINDYTSKNAHSFIVSTVKVTLFYHIAV
jgi:hypothetical protein